MENIIIEAFDFSVQNGKYFTTHGKDKKNINISSVKYLTCEGNYTTIYQITENSVLDRQSLINYEKLLSKYGFFRINDNTLINAKYISTINLKNTEKKVFLGENDFIFSRNRLKQLKKSKEFGQVLIDIDRL